MRARCPGCSTGYQLRDGAVPAGKRMRFMCKKCGARIVVLGQPAQRYGTSATRRMMSGETGQFDPVSTVDIDDDLPPPIAPRSRGRSSDAGGPPPVPVDEVPPPTPEHLKPPLPRPRAPADYVAQPSGWTTKEVVTTTVLVAVCAICIGALGALLWGQRSEIDDDVPTVAQKIAEPEDRAAPSPPAPPTSPTPAVVAARAEDPPVAANAATDEVPVAADAAVATQSPDASGEQPADSAVAGQKDAEHAASPDSVSGSASTDSGSAAAVDAQQTPDTTGVGENDVSPTTSNPTTAKVPTVSKTAGKPKPSSRKRARKRSAKRSWKARAKAVLARCDAYHRRVYELRRAVSAAKVMGDRDATEETRELQRYIQGKGGVEMEATMRDARTMLNEARDDRPDEERKWYERQFKVTCEMKAGRYPPNP